MSDPAPLQRRVERLGRAFMVDAAREAAFWDRFAAGAWEPETLALLARLTGPGVQFLDIGAWIGPTALFAAAGGAAVVAVEADPVALVWLRRNLALNPDMLPRVRVFDRVLAPEPGPVRFGTNRGKGGNSMSSTVHAEMATAWEMEAATPADLAAFAGPAARRVVKLDIEGGEYALLPRMGPALSGAQAALVSWHPGIARATGEQAAAALRALRGFEARRVAADGSLPRARRAPMLAALRLPLSPPEGEWLFLRGAARGVALAGAAG